MQPNKVSIFKSIQYIFSVNFIFIKIVIKELQEKPYLSMHANLYSLSTLTDGGDDALYRDELLDFAKFEANPDSPESIVSKKNNNNTIKILIKIQS